MQIALFKAKLTVAAKSTIFVLKNWRYSLLASVLAFLFLLLIYWLLNIDLLWFLMSSDQLSFADKIALLVKSAFSYVSSLGALQRIATLLLVIGQGVVIAMLVFVVRTQNTLDSKALGGGVIASIIAVFSVGCVSCGTSIVAPVVGLFFSGASVAVSDSIHKAAIYVSLIIVLYSLYAVGVSASTYVARQKDAL
jgi:hypothetical protein